MGIASKVVSYNKFHQNPMNDIHKIRGFMGKISNVSCDQFGNSIFCIISLFPFVGDVDKRLVYLSHLREL